MTCRAELNSVDVAHVNIPSGFEILCTKSHACALAALTNMPDQGGTLVLLGVAILGLFVLANRLRR